MVAIRLPDGSVREFPGPVTGRQVAESIGARLAQAAIGVKVDGALIDLDKPIERDAALAILTKPGKGVALDDLDKDALHLLRHSTAHVMAEAIQRLYPGAKLAYGPALDSGFYYDIALETPISSDDFLAIEKEMAKIVAENRPFTRVELAPAEGMKRLEAEGNKYKIDNAQRALEGGAACLSWYITGAAGSGAWEDLCMGPHLPSTGNIGAFKVTSVASSHWHGDVTSDRFQRVYGTAYFSQPQLDEYLARLENARQRDHRVIGSKLGLFAFDDMVGQGLVLWKPKGAMVRNILEDFLKKKLLQSGYDMVYTPNIGKIDLYKTSGHYPYYADSQFPPIQMRDSDEQYLLKPMNCPHHIRIFASDPHSYRDLPVRLAEFGTVYRFEQSGELSGLTRVRGFTQDDAHIFCTNDQVQSEFGSTVDLVQYVLNSLGFQNVEVRLSLSDPSSDKYAGDRKVWSRAEGELREVLQQKQMKFSEAPGEAAFYGPKVDFLVRDVIGRKWQLGTVQLDYVLPDRFKLEYIGADNATHRPVMIHRAPFGSMERFMAILIEHFAGAFPLWLAPEQVRVLPISEKFMEYAGNVLTALRTAGFRATLDQSPNRVQAKIKVAQEDKIPYMLVVGGRDVESQTVSIRDRVRADLGALPLQAFIDQATREVVDRGATQVTVA